ncbi:sugar nucleotide-binding protein [Natronomonas sp. F2-12]|uniref:Sugar nucleotide-binding protein n=1 Tax=Natronomonas aquatica TaxID=2841590 RepID=A0A9R1D6A0_9EURY|nr:sugar nucleotide-binding protein [Natronomonas aquatica]
MVNEAAPKEMARIADEQGVGFIQISTDYVFDGEKLDRCELDDTPNPIQAYEESKL